MNPSMKPITINRLDLRSTLEQCTYSQIMREAHTKSDATHDEQLVKDLDADGREQKRDGGLWWESVAMCARAGAKNASKTMEEEQVGQRKIQFSRDLARAAVVRRSGCKKQGERDAVGGVGLFILMATTRWILLSPLDELSCMLVMPRRATG